MKVKELIPLLGDSETNILIHNVEFLDKVRSKTLRGNAIGSAKANELQNNSVLNADILSVIPKLNHNSEPIIFIECKITE